MPEYCTSYLSRFPRRYWGNDNDNDNNFLVMKLRFHSVYKSNSIPNENSIFTCEENMYDLQCTGKMVIIHHDNEGMKLWLMGPNLYFMISRCQKNVQGNKIAVQYLGAVLITILMQSNVYCLSRTFIGKECEISINAKFYIWHWAVLQ